MEMKVGSTYRAVAFWQFANGNGPQKPKQRGRCVYVHPRGRFCVLEFRGGIRASYTPDELGKA